MINGEVATRTGASDVTGQVRNATTKRGKEDESGGFSNALSSLDNGSRKSGDDAAEGETTALSEHAEGTEETVAPKGRTMRELAASVLLGKSAQDEVAGERAGKSVKDVIAGKKGEAQTGNTKADATEKPTEQKNTTDTPLAPTKGVKAGSDEKAEAGTTEKTVKTGEAAQTSEVAGLNDVLSLLSSPIADQAAAAASRQAGQTGQVRERGENAGRGEKQGVSATEGRSAQASAAAKASDALETSSDDGVAIGDEQTFRFSSARGSGQSMDMKVGADEQGKVGFETKTAGGNAAENVVVLDSRRFLGFGQSTNGAALTAAISGDKSWASAMTSAASLSDNATSATGNVVNTLKLQMNPHDLGSVTATLRLSGETLNVHLTVENHAAYRQLNDDSSGMLEALRSQGFSVDQVTISVASTAQSDTGSNQQQGQQSGQQANQTGQQAMGHDGRQGNGPGREQNQANGQPATAEGARGSNETQSDAASAGGTRPDQLYL